MSLKTDRTLTEFSYDKTLIEKDGTAKVRVQLYNLDGSSAGSKWVDLNISKTIIDGYIAERDSKISALATDNGITEKVDENIETPA